MSFFGPSRSPADLRSPVVGRWSAASRNKFEYVVPVCDANEACPVLPGARGRLHCFFGYPSRAEGGGEKRLAVFRRVRDEVRAPASRESW